MSANPLTLMNCEGARPFPRLPALQRGPRGKADCCGRVGYGRGHHITDITPYLRFFDQATWLPWLESSAARLVGRLRHTPEAWLTRRIEMSDTPVQALSGWRLLMMMLEHEVHHRSQIDADAGLQGWPVPHIVRPRREKIRLRRHPVREPCKADQRGRIAPTAAAMNLGAWSWTRAMSGRNRTSTNPAASMDPFHCPGVRNPPLGR